MQLIKQFLRGSDTKYFVTAFLSSLLCIGDGFATVPSLKFPTQVFHATIDWVLDKTVGGVDFYHAITICDGKKVVFLKFVNSGSKPVKISWKEIFITKLNEQKEGYRGKKEMIIPPGTTSPSDCFDSSTRLAIINSSEIHPTSIIEISNFIYNDVIVENF